MINLIFVDERGIVTIFINPSGCYSSLTNAIIMNKINKQEELDNNVLLANKKFNNWGITYFNIITNFKTDESEVTKEYNCLANIAIAAKHKANEYRELVNNYNESANLLRKSLEQYLNSEIPLVQLNSHINHHEYRKFDFEKEMNNL